MDKNFDEIMTEYEPLLRSSAVAYAGRTGQSTGDMYQIASLALHRAYLTFEEGRGLTFGLYAKICVKNACISEQRKKSAASRRESRAGYSSEPDAGTTGLPNFAILDLTALSTLEKNVLLSRADGLSYAEIAEELGIGTKSVDNALRRAKDKLREIYRRQKIH